MKKLIAVLLSVLMLAGLAGCGKKTSAYGYASSGNAFFASAGNAWYASAGNAFFASSGNARG